MPRSVTFVNRYFHPDHSATSQLLSDLAFGLAERGWQVDVLTSRQLYEDPDASLDSHETVHGVRVQRLATTRFGRSRVAGRVADYLSFHVRAYGSLRKRDPSGIVVAMTDPPLIATTVALALDHPQDRLVIWTQDLFPESAEVYLRRGNRPLRGLLRWLRNLGARRSAVTVAVGERMKEQIEHHTSRVEVVPNWAIEESVQARRKAFRSRHGIDDTAFVVGYSGNFGRVHDFDPILEAMKELRRSEIRFLLTGGGRQFSRVRQFVELNHLQNVTLLPYQPRELLGEALAASDVHLVTLDPGYEGLVVPSKFYGIAAAGRPTLYVGESGGDIARLVTEFDCGAVVAPGDGGGLTRTIRELADQPDRVREMGENARQAWRENWTKEAAVERWDSLLREVGGWGSVIGDGWAVPVSRV